MQNLQNIKEFTTICRISKNYITLKIRNIKFVKRLKNLVVFSTNIDKIANDLQMMAKQFVKNLINLQFARNYKILQNLQKISYAKNANTTNCKNYKNLETFPKVYRNFKS